MVKGWPQKSGWGQAEEWQQQQEAEWMEEAPRPPQNPPPSGNQQRVAPAGWKRQLPQPGQGKGKAMGAWGQGAEDYGEEAGWGEEQHKPSSAVAAPALNVQPRPGETERQAKVRAMAERIRAEARRSQQAEGAEEASTPAAPRMPTASDRQKEEADAQKWEAILPKLEEKCASAEDEAEKVAILAAPLAMEAAEELRDLQLSAVRETERAVKAALGNVAKTRREMDMQRTGLKAFAPLVREGAQEELGKLALRLDSVQAKLEEHKNVRKDHELALQAEKLFGELASRLAGVEIDCEKAAMMAEPLAKALDAAATAAANEKGAEKQTQAELISSAEIRETKEVLRVAQATLAPTMRLISGKVSGLKGSARSKMLDLQGRAEASQALLDKTQKTVEEAQSRATAIPILKQAQERVATIEEVLQKMRETEAPFLMGIETMPPEEASEVLTRMDKAAAVAQSALADATKYIALKTVEVGRLAEGAAESARRELDRVKQQLDEGVARVKAFQVEASKRRRMNLVEVVKGKIEDAEAAVSRMKEAGLELQSNSDPANVSEVLDKAHAAELEAQNAVTTARRELQEKQKDLRPLEQAQGGEKGSSEILQTKVRVNYMEAELTKFRKLARDFEEKIKVGKSLTEVLENLKQAEEEVETLTAASTDGPVEGNEKSVATTQSKLSATTVQVEAKLRTAQGLELKELRGVFGRLQRAQIKLDKVKDQSRERNRSISMQTVKEATDALQKAETCINALSLSGLGSFSLTKLEALHQDAATALEAMAVARTALAQGQGMETTAKVELARLQLRFKALERKGKAATDVITSHFDRAAGQATQQVLDALRSAARREDGSYDAEGLFTELSGSSGGEVVEGHFAAFIAKQNKGESALPEDRVTVAFKKIAPHGTMRRTTFLAALADFHKVVRDITVTDSFEIQNAKKVRKLKLGEVVEALCEAKEDSTLGLQRVRCRAVSDDTTGWVTLRSAAGAVYLEHTEKPFLWVSETLQLRSKAVGKSTPVRELKAGEVVELIQGPSEQRLGSDARVRGTACSEDGATGWLQVRDKDGGIQAKTSSSIYTCAEAVAMTDAADFANCNMVRRINFGEALEVVTGEKEQKSPKGGMRKKFRACRDGAEGWVTVVGDQGTVYVKLAPGHYVVTQPTPLHAGLGAESAVVRVLMEGEAFAASGDPKEVAGGETLSTYRVRTLLDGKDGFVTATSAEEVRPWSARCKILRTVQLTKGFPANEAAEVIEVVRLLEPGEIVTVTEQPMEDSSSGQLRACLLAQKDKAVGWATVREGTSLLLQPVGPEEATGASTEPTQPTASPKPSQAASAKRPTPPTTMPVGPPLKRPKGKGKGK